MRDTTTDRDTVRDLGTVGNAFFGQFPTLREVQRRAIPPIHAGGNVLVTSATASGKTEAVIAPLVARTRDIAPKGHGRIRMLLIAPTRALVNDLAARLEVPLNRLGLTCGRQTSDHRDKSRQPFVLITTPESFDSMLVRDARKADGAVVDHLLAGVLAVFVDEAHLFDGSARGDQLCWLLARLRRLKRMNVDQLPDESSRLQVCAASATVSDSDGLAGRLLGPNGIALRVPGTREIDVFLSSDWIPLDSVENVVSLRDRLELAPSRKIAECAAERLRQAMAPADEVVRKALVFVPSRRLCDILSTHLRGALSRHRDIFVLAHHGSLARRVREEAEQTFAAERDAVLVATTTLEVGVDIGDVDLVVLVGAPPVRAPYCSASVEAAGASAARGYSLWPALRSSKPRWQACCSRRETAIWNCKDTPEDGPSSCSRRPASLPKAADVVEDAPTWRLSRWTSGPATMRPKMQLSMR